LRDQGFEESLCSHVHNEGDVHQHCAELEHLQMDTDEGSECSASSDNESTGEDVPDRDNAAENLHTSEEEENTILRPLPKRRCYKVKKKVLALD
jgi:hypothetical protein